MTDAQAREEALRVLATHADLPPELAPTPTTLTRAQQAALHELERAERVVADVCDQLTRVYLRPALAAAGIPHPEQYHLSYGETP